MNNVVLDCNQKNIVESPEKKIAVIAGAGSGKTAVLTQRIRFLVEKKRVDPASITAITFTNMAADEMKERLADIQGVRNMFIGTIHSFANHILKESGNHYGILSDDVYATLVAELITNYCKHLTVEKYVEYDSIVKAYKSGDTKVTRAMIDNFFTAPEKAELEVITCEDPNATNARYPENVYSLCKKRDILTFDELIIKAQKYISNENRIKYLFVDEYQDVGNLEDDFIRTLNAENYFIVGDDWQSIYGWKGANVAIFKSYVQSKEWRVYRLDNNYRNAVDIISFAEEVISSVDNRLKKRIIAMNRDRGNVTVDKKEKLYEQLRKIKKRKNFKDWFILTRTRKDMNEILRVCEEEEVPAVSFSKADLSLEELRGLMAENKIKVLTVHAAKGLETNNVILYGNFPVQMKREGNDTVVKLERKFEERRIMYVGITRARNRIVVLN